jgi:hypothetical protein
MKEAQSLSPPRELPLKSARERIDIISAYREAGMYRGAAAISGTTPKTVKRVIARHQAGGGAAAHASPSMGQCHEICSARPIQMRLPSSASSFRRSP